VVPVLAASDALAAAPQWLEKDAEGQVRVPLYVFWSKSCPHCREALSFLSRVRSQYPWLEVLDFELTGSRENVQRFIAMAAGLGEEAQSVPSFFVCGQMLTGFDDESGIGQEVLRLALFCREAGRVVNPNLADPVAEAAKPDQEFTTVELPWFGSLEAGALSLPLLTLVLAGLDAFNPCAFFVLLFLLSLMIHARGRGRMLLVGITFVLFSGLVYFLFMAAWLNLFLVVGVAPVVTVVAGVVAVLIGAINMKDYFWSGQGPSLSIPEPAKPGLFKRMRALVSADRLGAVLVGTVLLALAANSYELLCTAGFPMVYTRVLTLNHLDPAAHYGYLALYNLIYVLPLLTIVLVFSFTLGVRKLTEAQGRVLKLLSGLMMFGLSLVMLLAPEWLSRPLIATLLLGVSLVLVGGIALWSGRASGR
jgi:glutaredoxin-related protein